MEIRTFPVGSYQTNCYIAWGEGSGRCIIIDPGYEPEFLLEQATLLRKQVEAILLTHGHFDHVGGVKQIAKQTGCKVYICEEDLSLNPMLTAGAIYYTDTYADGDILSLAGLELKVMQTPGHTPGSVCLLCGSTMFSGDTLFAGSIGRTDFPGGSYKTMLVSLACLSDLQGDYRVLPGHGEETTLETERTTNPYMRL